MPASSYGGSSARWALCVLIAAALMLPGTWHLSYADPPPWAPAHGYYKKRPKQKQKQKHGHEQEVAEAAPEFISGGRCNREQIGEALGAVLGGVVGAQVTEGDARPVGVIAGAIIGYIVGGGIGRSMDERDRACVGQALEYAEDHQTITWQNPERHATYHVTPLNTYAEGNQYCREYTRTTIVDGRQREAVGEACRQADGLWKVIR